MNAAVTFAVLSEQERDLLLWLATEDFSQYGECYGTALDRLIEMWLVQVHEPGQHQHFIANDHAGTKGDMYRAVSLTEYGWKVAREGAYNYGMGEPHYPVPVTAEQAFYAALLQHYYHQAPAIVRALVCSNTTPATDMGSQSTMAEK